MIRGILLFSVFLLCLPAWAKGATYYLNDTGSDGNGGTSTSVPWLTWAHAFANSACGDRLIVMNGTYTRSRNGTFSLTKVCTAGAVYTVIAQNERAALISGDGAAASLFINNSAYITVEGLRVKSVDNASGSTVSIVFVNNSNHITLRRMLVTHNNRYFNTHVIQLSDTTHSLVEENELYWFHRHGIFFTNSSQNVARRNYCNSRNYTGIPGGYSGTSGENGYGDSCVAIYPASNIIVENNISDGGMNKAYTLQASALSTGNKFYGNIALNPYIGVSLDVRGAGATLMPQNTTIKDMLVVSAMSTEAIRSIDAKNTTCTNCSVIGGSAGIIAKHLAGYGDGEHSFFATDSLVLNTRGTGFTITSVPTWLLRYTSSYGNADDYVPNPNHANITQRITANPNIGSCRAWIPAGSPLKGVGLNGGDVGATILYRYQAGVLTTAPLWHPATGAFPGGAVIAGVNDVAGQSLFDVHKRLNINTNGCAFPANYGNGVTNTEAPDAPRNLTIF